MLRMWDENAFSCVDRKLLNEQCQSNECSILQGLVCLDGLCQCETNELRFIYQIFNEISISQILFLCFLQQILAEYLVLMPMLVLKSVCLTKLAWKVSALKA